MARRRFHWSFWVGSAWAFGCAAYAVWAHFTGQNAPSNWLGFVFVLPVFVLYWVHAIKSSDDDIKWQEARIRREVKQAIDAELRPRKPRRVVDASAERLVKPDSVVPARKEPAFDPDSLGRWTSEGKPLPFPWE